MLGDEHNEFEGDNLHPEATNATSGVSEVRLSLNLTSISFMRLITTRSIDGLTTCHSSSSERGISAIHRQASTMVYRWATSEERKWVVLLHCIVLMILHADTRSSDCHGGA